MLKEKVDRARKHNEEIVAQKVNRTQAELDIKDALAKQELERLKAQQERRRNIKLIRLEAFELSAYRRKKADDYKQAKLRHDLKIKDDRYQAVREGERRLQHMRHTMHEIVKKTKFELRSEVERLKHKDELSPEKVGDL